MTIQFLLVGVGGFGGAVARYALGRAFSGTAFPYATLLVNVLGSLLIGLLAVALAARTSMGDEARLVLMVGFLGAFTTFSTFSLDTLNLIQNDDWIRALLNVTANVALCLLAVGIGAMMGRQLVH